MKEIRVLRADEIDARVGQQKKDNSGCSLLLYKDARVDMTILDEVFGPMNWQRRHSRDNANCIVSVWDDEKKCWVDKEDTGTESNTEKEKGLASDSFKRACTNWGIGRELYTAPFIWINLTQGDLDKQGRIKTKFKVTDIEYDEQRQIRLLEITDNKGTIRYSFGKAMKRTIPKDARPDLNAEPEIPTQVIDFPPAEEKPQKDQLLQELLALCHKFNVMPSNIAAAYKVAYIDELSEDLIRDAMSALNKKYGKAK